MNMTQRAIGLVPLVTFIFTFLFPRAQKIQTKLIKGQGRFFSFKSALFKYWPYQSLFAYSRVTKKCF